jgi:hypothetical protein
MKAFVDIIIISKGNNLCDNKKIVRINIRKFRKKFLFKRHNLPESFLWVICIENLFSTSAVHLTS